MLSNLKNKKNKKTPPVGRGFPWRWDQRTTNISGDSAGFCRCSVESPRSVKPVNVCSNDVTSSPWHHSSCSSRNAGSYLYLQRLRSKPNTDFTLPPFPADFSFFFFGSDLNRSGQVLSWIRNYFPNLCGSPCLSFVQLRTEVWVSPIAPSWV